MSDSKQRCLWRVDVSVILACFGVAKAQDLRSETQASHQGPRGEAKGKGHRRLQPAIMTMTRSM